MVSSFLSSQVAGNPLGQTLPICLVAVNYGLHPGVIASVFSWLFVLLVYRKVVGNGRTLLAA